MAKENVVAHETVDGIEMKVLEIQIRDGKDAEGKDRILTHRYVEPKTVEDLIRWQAVNPDRVQLLKRWHYAEDLYQRANQRESTAVILPEIMTKRWGKLNLVSGKGEKGDASLAERVTLINSAYKYAADSGGDPLKAVQAARAQLIESKQARDRNGALVAAQ